MDAFPRFLPKTECQLGKDERDRQSYKQIPVMVTRKKIICNEG